MGPVGSEQGPDSPGNTHNRSKGGAKCGALSGADPDLARIVRAWPSLSEKAKARMLAILSRVAAGR